MPCLVLAALATVRPAGATQGAADAPQADLTVSMSDDIDPVAPGESITYTVVVTNRGPDTAIDVVAATLLPYLFTLESTTGCAEDPSGVPTCSLGEISAGDSVEYRVSATVGDWQDGVGYARASVTSATLDPFPGNDGTTELTDVPAGGKLVGLVSDLGPAADAPVQICDVEASCTVTTTNSDGEYRFVGVEPDAYELTAYSSAGSSSLPTTAAPITVEGNEVQTIDVRLDRPLSPPAGTAITPTRGSDAGGVFPTVWSDEALELVSADRCAEGSGSFDLTSRNGQLITSGPMTEGEPGRYSTSIPPLFPYSGYATVSIVVDCPEISAEAFDQSQPDQLDVEGDEVVVFTVHVGSPLRVMTLEGDPLVGASVQLSRFPSGSRFGLEPLDDGNPFMTPANRTSPEMTDEQGRFGWDLVAGRYHVRTRAPGCGSTGDPDIDFAERYFEVPPQASGLDLVLYCESEAPDVEPPTWQVPDELGVEAAPGELTAVVDYEATASDDTGVVSSTCTPPSGAAFPLGTTTVTCTATDAAGNTGTASFDVTVTSTALLFTTSRSGAVGDLRFRDEDIVTYDPTTGEYGHLFDGSDLSIGADLTGFELLDDGTILMTFDQPVRLEGLGRVDDSDIVRFQPRSLGPDTAGDFELFLDGSDLGLTGGSEDIDAIAITPDGRLVISTIGHLRAGTTRATGNDLVVLEDATYGPDTTGALVTYFDGSIEALTRRSERLTGATIDPATTELTLTTRGWFRVPGTIGRAGDLLTCTPDTVGDTIAACTYQPTFDELIKKKTNGIHLGPPRSLSPVIDPDTGSD